MSRSAMFLAAVLASMLVPLQHAAASGSGSFSATGSLGTQRGGTTAAPLPGGRVLVVGGLDGSNMTLSSAEVFDPATNTFSSAGIGSLTTGRYNAAAAPLPGGKVLVAGGNNGAVILPNANAEIFDPATGTFSSAGIGPMVVPRASPAAAPLPDGRVLLAGGNNNTGFLKSAEVFDPGTKTFSPVGDMGSVRTGAVAAPLPDGRVLVAGGRDDDPIHASAEIFDPKTNTFSSAGIGSMGTARVGAVAAPLPDGRVLVAGGNDPSSYLASAEVFNPTTNSFSSAGIGSMTTARSGAAAAPLGDGRVLVAGGQDAAGYLSSAEIFSATNAFSVKVKGKKLIVSVQASGKVSVSDAASKLSAAAAKKRRLSLKPSSGSGDPPKITVKLHLTKTAKRSLRQKGKVAVSARITFTPQGGLANTRTAKLKIQGKNRK
jgi:hypothetical protein